MQKFKTTSGRPAGVSDIVFYLEVVAQPYASWLLGYFETAIKSGIDFKAGQTVQIGWMTVMLQKNEERELEVFEPDFESIPVQWVRGTNTTLRHLFAQKAVCEEFSCDPVFPSILELGIVSPNFFLAKQGFQMSRDKAESNDSGWVFAEANYSGTNGQYSSLYQIGLQHPKSIPFMALPSGFIVRITSKEVIVSSSDRVLSSKTSSLLRGLARIE